MTDAAEPSPFEAGPLAMLGFVAALLVFVAERVMPRWRGCAAADLALLRLQAAMVVLAASAWAGIEAEEGERPRRALPDPEDALVEVHAALVALLAIVSAMPCHRRRRGPRRTRREGRRALRALPRLHCAPFGRARDGPVAGQSNPA